jgi:hypothetical protein
MSTLPTKRGVTMLAGAVSMAIALALFWKPLRIQYHRNIIRDSRSPGHEVPTHWHDYLSARTILWISRGCPEAQKIMEGGRMHEDALVRLGYFDRRWYHFTNRNNMNPGELVSTIRTGPLHDDLCYFSFDQNGSLEVVAHRGDFPRIELSIRRFGGEQ